jgi:transcription-repair coupling factor (superfamily II helicase)
MYCRLLKESVSRLKGDDVSLRPSATTRLDFLVSGEKEEGDTTPENPDHVAGAYFPIHYTPEPRLRIEGYRRLSQIREIKEIEEYQDELKDRFGPPPTEVMSLLKETRIRCLCEEIGFDHLEVKGSELFCRFAKRGRQGEKNFHRILGRIPKLSAKDPLLKLKEIIAFLSMIVHGNKND